VRKILYPFCSSAATSFTKVKDTPDDFQFSYPAFTFKGEKGKYILHCNYSVHDVPITPSLNSSLILSIQDLGTIPSLYNLQIHV